MEELIINDILLAPSFHANKHMRLEQLMPFQLPPKIWTPLAPTTASCTRAGLLGTWRRWCYDLSPRAVFGKVTGPFSSCIFGHLCVVTHRRRLTRMTSFQPFQCRLCSIGFTKRNNAARHIQQQHHISRKKANFSQLILRVEPPAADEAPPVEEPPAAEMPPAPLDESPVVDTSSSDAQQSVEVKQEVSGGDLVWR